VGRKVYGVNKMEKVLIIEDGIAGIGDMIQCLESLGYVVEYII